MAFLSPTVYVLDERKSNWSAEQEKGLLTNYPFDLRPDDVDAYVARTYLQFLWLPNSLMPLTYLIPSLRRIEVPSSSTVLHLMHTLLEPLLLTTRSVANKYHSELVQILANGGGAGEMEEAMMWYDVEHEKPLHDGGLPGDSDSRKHGHDGEGGQWTDQKWRAQYSERMERREVQIQILLYMFKISLPGYKIQPSSLDSYETTKASRSGKRKRSSKSVDIEQILSIEDQLEAFMDKLAMWQLIGGIDESNGGSASTKGDERDWTQIFVEDVVEPHFKTQLPELCKLLRTKVFPTSPFSDTESDSRGVSLEPKVAPLSPTTIYVPTVALPRTSSSSNTLSRAPSLSRYTSSPTHSIATLLSSHNMIRSRSNSLSVSLAQEQEERAAAAATSAEQQTKKRGRFYKEVSMTRVFKGKGKGKNLGGPDAERKTSRVESVTVEIETTRFEKNREDKGVTLVDETPIKPRVLSTLHPTRNAVIDQDVANRDAKGAPMLVEDEDQDEEWRMDGSPVVLVFDPALDTGTDEARINGSDKSNLTEEKVGSSPQMMPTRSKLLRKRQRKK